MPTRRTTPLALAALLLAGGSLASQTPVPAPNVNPIPVAPPVAPPAVPATPAARPADVASLDAIIAALYDVISGPAGQPRDWDRMRSLFLPGARMIPTGPRREGGFAARGDSVGGYVARNAPFFAQNGFFEREVARHTERWSNIAHVWSTYEARTRASDAQPMMRGINTIQLFHDGTRWWIAGIMWEAERPGGPALPRPSRR